MVLATTVAIVGSLVADAILVAIGTTAFPVTAGYEHFRFDGYAKLTVIGAVVGCAGWPVVTRVSSQPLGLFLRLAVVISLALFVPDIWLLVRGEPFDAVGILVLMHVAVALITYHAAVRLAPPAAHPAGDGYSRKESTRRTRPQ